MVYSDVKNSRINSKEINVNQNSKKEWNTWIAIIIAAMTFIVTCIIGWSNIVDFFKLMFHECESGY